MIKKLKAKLYEDRDFSDIINASLVAFILKVIGITLGFIFILLISNNYGASTVGIFTLSFTVLQITSIIARLGLDTVLLKLISILSVNNGSKAKGIYFKVMILVTFTSIIFSCTIFYSAPFIAAILFNNFKLAEAFQIISFGILPFALLYLNFETLRAFKKIKYYSFFQNVSIFLFSIIFLIFFLKFNLLPKDIILIFVISIYLTWLLSQYKTYKIFRNYSLINSTKVSKLLEMSFPMMLASSLMLIMGWTDTIMVSYFLTEEEVGIFSIALKIATLVSITLVAVNSIIAPKFSELYNKNDMFIFQKVVTQSSKLIFWSSLPLLLISLSFPSFIMSLFGLEFVDGSTALIILLIGQFINVLSGSVGYILQMTGQEKFFQKIIMISLISNILLNYLFIPIYGIEGAAIASTLSLAFWNIGSVLYIKKSLNINTVFLKILIKEKLWKK